MMFSIILAANITYGLSVILGGLHWLKILKHLPWLFGSLGCCLLDVVIVGQHFAYKNYAKKDKDQNNGGSASSELLLDNKHV